MLNTRCENCGSQEFELKDGYKVCVYCGSKYEIEKKITSNISVKSDVEMLLEKCKLEPTNAKRYANLVLDLDPTNKEAKRYL